MEPLFTQDFLSHYIPNFKLSNVPNVRLARNIIAALIEDLNSGKLESLKEEEFKSRFLNEFFGDVLGFNYGNSNYWNLREEAKTKVDATKPDGVLGFFNKSKEQNDVRVVIEIKDAKTNLDKKQKRNESKSPVAQAFEYSTKMGENCNWVVVSNFKEIRFYSSKFQGKYQTFFLEELSNEDKFKELLFLFHKDKFVHKNRASSTEQLYKRSGLKLKEDERPKHIVDELYFSIIRFRGLQYVDPNYLASIKPFNILTEYVWHYHSGNLLTINPKTHNLFKNLEFNDGIITISEQLKQELKDNKVIEYEDKIGSFIRFLNHSGITEISCIKDYKSVIIARSGGIGFSHKHHFGFSDKEGFTKNIDVLKYISCDCISCNFSSLDFRHLLSKLKLAINNEDFANLEYAYGNYLVSSNNYKNAFNIYKKFSEKVKGKEGYEVEYFLAKLNMKYLLHLVWEDEKLHDSFVIKDEIRSIDLNKILYEEIEYAISDDVRNYLLKIKDDNLLRSVKKEVNELVDKITNLKEFYDKGNDHYSGSNFIQELANEFDRLQLHLNRNRIIYNVFHDYKLLTAKIFEGFILSYLTKGNGLISFNSFYLLEFLINTNPKEFQKALSKVESIKLEKNEDEKLIRNITNLFKSYFNDGLFANSYFKDRILEEYLIDMQFNDRYTELISNSFTLLSRIDLSEKIFNNLSKTIIDFLSIEDDLSWYQLEELGKFITEKGNSFSSEQLIRIIEIAIERDKPNNNKYEKLIRVTSLTIHQFYPNTKINNKRLVKKVVSNINGISKWRYASFLLKVTDEKCQAILQSEIEDMLDEELDFDFYDHLIRKELYDYKKKGYFKRLVEDVSATKELGFKNEFKNGKPVFEGFRFYNFVILLSILGIDRQSKLLNVFKSISDYEKWLLRPKDYDYSNFDVKWLLASDNKYILKSLRGIKDLLNVVDSELKKEFNPTLSEIYYKYLL